MRVGILGATGAVGQKLVRLLSGHPWFRVTALTASHRSAGKAFGDAVRWLEPAPLPPWAADMVVQGPEEAMDCDFVFSALDGDVAQHVEPSFVARRTPVFSNAKSFRMNPHVPLLVPEVNLDHAEILGELPPGDGFIVANPNCSTTGLVMALKPLADRFPLDRVSVTTLQAVSGAGYPGVPAMDIMGNALPHIPGEEEKLETEPLKILGRRKGSSVEPRALAISAQANRIPVLDGHLLSVSVGFQDPVDPREAVQAFEEYQSPLRELELPSAPIRPLVHKRGRDFPQPRLHAGTAGGMAVSIGQVRSCPVLDLRFVALVHNTIRGAAGGAILNAESLRARGILKGHPSNQV